MTRKNYKLIAAAFRETLEDNPYTVGSDFWVCYRMGIRCSVRAMVTKLSQDNPRFSRTKFLYAIYSPVSEK
jgi:hypothetical protein